ncbi:MAG: extracellular solute-binding protein, partial [Acidimicrobiia bacterium]|nr:extracellular solute-binding protein [Acidimicrobiia bacterium]
GMPEGNSVVGGGCLWVFDGHDEAVYDGTWQFFEFLSQLEQDTKWHKETGYFPVRQETYQALQDEGWFEDEPNHATAFDQILSGNDSPASQGVLLGGFVEIRDVVGVAIERALTEGTDAQNALDEVAEQSNQILTDYAAQIGE